MDQKYRTVRRLGIAGLGAIVMVGSSALGFVGTAAAAAGTGVTIVSQTTQAGSINPDGTNSTIKVSAVTVGGSDLPSGAVGVKFTLTQSDNAGNPTPGGAVLTQTDTSAPYSVEFAPSVIGFYNESAVAVDSGGSPVGNASTTPTNPIQVGAYPSVHISSPSENGTIGVSGAGTVGNAATFRQGYIAVSGTRSADLPALSISAETRDDATGFMTAAGAASVVPADATISDPNTWSASVAVPQCLSSAGTPSNTGVSCDVIIIAKTTGGAVNSDEATQATLYQQELVVSQGSLTVTPNGPTVPADSNAASATNGTTFTIKAQDQFGKPIAQLSVRVCPTAQHGGITYADPASVTTPAGQTPSRASSAILCNLSPLIGGRKVITGPDGTTQLNIADTAAETTNFVATSDFANQGTPNLSNGNFSDVQSTFSLTTYTAQPSAQSNFIALPDKPLYASQTEYTAYTNGAETTSNTPQTDICLVDQNGNPFGTSSSTPPSNLFVKITRTFKTSPGGSTTTEIYSNDPSDTSNVNYVSTVTLTKDSAASRNNCYNVSHPGVNSDYIGQDVYSAYLNNDAVAGFQPGNGDTQTASKTLKYSQLTISGNGTTLGSKGSNVTGHFSVVGTDGAPFANRKIALTLSPTGSPNTPSFPSAGQPAGTTAGPGANPTTATCTTTSTGSCDFVVTEPAAPGNPDNTFTVTAHDTLYDNGTTSVPASGPFVQIPTGDTATEDFTFTNTSTAVTSAVVSSESAIYPSGTNGTTTENVGAPGAPVKETLTLKNQSGQPLTNVSGVTVTTDRGFFTPVSSTFPGLSFTKAPAEGEAVTSGDPAAADLQVDPNATNAGQTLAVSTDGNGQFTVELGIGRSTGFDDDGAITATLTVAANGGTVTATGGPSPTWSTNSDVTHQSPVNPGIVKLLPATSSDHLSGKVQEEQGQQGTSSDVLNGTNFLIHTTDAWGNLVQDKLHSITLSGTGANTRIDAGTPGVAEGAQFGSYTNADNALGIPSSHNVTSNASGNTAGQDVTLTATWHPRTTSYTQHFVMGAPTVPPTYDIIQGSTTATDSFTITLYEIDFNNLNIGLVTTPASIVKTGTTVHDDVTVTDQNSNPVHGLIVNVEQSGPGPIDNHLGPYTTNQQGVASAQFSSNIQGDSTVTIDVSEAGSNVPLSEKVNTVSFDGVPTISVTPASRTGAGHVTISGVTRGGASVQLYARVGSGTTNKLGSPQLAQTDGSYSFSTSISKTTKFAVVVDNLRGSAVKTATVHAKKIVEKPTLKLKSKKSGKLTATATTHPSLSGATVRFYTVSGSGHRSLLGTGTTNGSGKAKATFDLTAGKTYTLVAKAVHIGKKYKSAFSNAHTAQVKP